MDTNLMEYDEALVFARLLARERGEIDSIAGIGAASICGVYAKSHGAMYVDDYVRVWASQTTLELHIEWMPEHNPVIGMHPDGIIYRSHGTFFLVRRYFFEHRDLLPGNPDLAALGTIACIQRHVIESMSASSVSASDYRLDMQALLGLLEKVLREPAAELQEARLKYRLLEDNRHFMSNRLKAATDALRPLASLKPFLDKTREIRGAGDQIFYACDSGTITYGDIARAAQLVKEYDNGIADDH